MGIRVPILLCFVFCLALSACQTSPVRQPSDSLFVRYHLRYLVASSTLDIEARILRGDSLHNALPISNYPGISFMDTPLKPEKHPEKGHRYLLRKSLPYTNSFDFSFEDNRGNTHVHTFSMLPIDSFRMQDNKINLSRGTTFSFSGQPLQNDEALVLWITDKNKKAALFEIQGPLDKNQALLPPENVRLLSPGPAKLTLVKKQYTSFSQDHAHVSAEIEFHTHTTDTSIRD